MESEEDYIKQNISIYHLFVKRGFDLFGETINNGDVYIKDKIEFLKNKYKKELLKNEYKKGVALSKEIKEDKEVYLS